jgi:hypothetical protein
MIGCLKKRLSISRLIDNDLSHDESEQLKEHIFVCKRCNAIYKEYLTDRNVVNDVFDSESAPFIPVKKVIVQKRFQLSDVISRPLFSAVGFTLLVLIAARVTIIEKPFSSAFSKPVLIQSSASIMNTPLGSLAYYEDFAGKTVHSQFITLSDKPAQVIDKNTYNQLRYITYTSPLFYDSELENNRSDTWSNGSVNTISTQD